MHPCGGRTADLLRRATTAPLIADDESEENKHEKKTLTKKKYKKKKTEEEEKQREAGEEEGETNGVVGPLVCLRIKLTTPCSVRGPLNTECAPSLKYSTVGYPLTSSNFLTKSGSCVASTAARTASPTNAVAAKAYLRRYQEASPHSVSIFSLQDANRVVVPLNCALAGKRRV